MADVLTRAGKGSALSHANMDDNWEWGVCNTTTGTTLSLTQAMNRTTQVFTGSSATVWSLPAASGLVPDTGDWVVLVKNLGTANITLQVNSGETTNKLEGTANETLVLLPKESTLVVWDGTTSSAGGFYTTLTNKNPTVQVFTTANDGIGAWTKPAGCKKIKLTLTGGGGAGGGSKGDATGYSSVGSGGGAGATIIKYIDVTGVTGADITIGSGGTGVANAAGGDGVASTYSDVGYSGSTSLSADYGNGGGSANGATRAASGGGGGGSASGGDVNIDGGFGGQSVSETIGVGGNGGSSFWGGGAYGASVISGQNQSGGAATCPGAGGGGSCTINDSGGHKAGGNGAEGIAVIEEFY